MSSKQIWVDADACPNVIKEILFRAADRVPLMLTLVANQPVQVPGSRNIRTVQVSAGFDVADNYIVQQAAPGDLVITADIPLASEVIDKGCLALNPRGELYTRENIRQRLNMRDFPRHPAQQWRRYRWPTGVQQGRPAGVRQPARPIAGSLVEAR